MATGCVLWKGAKYGSGYGMSRHGGRRTGAHRAAWMKVHGPIPEGMEIDHLCNVRLCVNVEHMQLVTHRENTQLRESRRKTCKRGHPKAGLGRCETCFAAYQQSAEFRSSVRKWELKNLEKRREYRRQWYLKRKAAKGGP